VNDQVIPNKDIKKIMKKIAGYVTQDDHLLPNLTVRETLTFAAMLKLPSNLTKEEKLAQVLSFPLSH
jgi:ABC-type multidrug transport system ATPase subunit